MLGPWSILNDLGRGPLGQRILFVLFIDALSSVIRRVSGTQKIILMNKLCFSSRN